MKRKILSMVIVLCMLMAFVPCARAAEVVDSGQCGDNLTWSFDTDGTLTISGEGDMIDFTNTRPWEAHRNDISSVVIKNGVTSIGAEAFRNYYKHINSISLPNSITKIANYAFYGCDMLTYVNLPENVISIGNYAFGGCDLLESVHMYNKITDIGIAAFAECPKLQTINISSGVDNISERLFDSCYSLTSINLHNGIKRIGDSAFYMSGLTSIDIPDSVSYIGIGAFWGSKIANVTIPNSVKNIDNYAFAYCENLTDVYIPAQTQQLGDNIFRSCRNLNINVDANNDNYASIDGVLFNKACTKIVCYAKDKTQSNYKIPDGVVEISNGCFSGCVFLTDVEIPKGVTLIGDNAFSWCGLKNIHIPQGVESIGYQAFYLCDVVDIFLPDSIRSFGEEVFRWCNNLSDIYYGGSKEQWDGIIGDNVYDIENVTIHYNYREPNPPRIADTPNVNNGEITVGLADVEYTSNMIAVFADNNGLVAAETVELTAGDTEKSVEIPSGATQAKIFIWDSLTGMRPLCEPVTVNISGE